MVSTSVQHIWKHVLRFLLGIAILVVLLQVVEVKQWERIFYFDWRYMVLAVVASFAGNIAGTLRWRHSLHAVKAPGNLNFLDLLKVYMSGTVLGFAFAGGGMSLTYQALALKKQWGVSLRKVALSLAIDRILDPFLSILIFLVAILYLSGKITLHQFSVVICLLAVIFISVLAFSGRHLRSLFIICFRLLDLSGKAAKRIKNFLIRYQRSEPVAPITPPDLETLPFSPFYLASLTLSRMFFFILRLQFLSYAFGIMMPVEIVLIGMIVLQLSWLLSVTPGGIGIAEWGWVAILLKYGYSGSDAAFLSVAFRAYLIIFSLLTLLIAFILWICQNRLTAIRVVKT
jgi:uncharacterized protein (TIRG00374 family)